MAKKPETIFKERAIAAIGNLPRTYVVKTQEVSKRGVLDMFVCVDGHFVAIELKKSQEEKPDPLQEWNICRVNSCGGTALAAYPENWKLVYEVLEDISLKGVIPYKSRVEYINNYKETGT